MYVWERRLRKMVCAGVNIFWRTGIQPIAEILDGGDLLEWSLFHKK